MTHKPNPRRAELIALSAAVRPLVAMQVFPNVNAAIRAHYERETGQSEWNTFKGWIDAGRPVRKGESGFPVWGTPKRGKAEGAGGDLAQLAALNGIEPQGPEFFPVAYLFHAGQVQALEQVAA